MFFLALAKNYIASFDWCRDPSAITFAATFVFISAVTTWMRTAFDQTGVLALAAIIGPTDIDPFVIDIAQGGLVGLSVPALCAAVLLIAASSNNIAKAIYALAFAVGEGASRSAALMLFALALCGLAAAAFYARSQPQF